MPTFTPDRSLLNPKFDGYKFSPLEYDEVTAHYPLEHKLSQTNVSGRAPLSFQEVQSRVLHNHIAICSQTRRAVYVDAELRVIGIDLDEDSLKPAFRVLCELPRPIQSSAVDSLQREYPSAAFVDATSLLVADGYGTLYALRLGDVGPAEVLASYELSIPAAYESSQTSVPSRLHQAISPDGQNIIAVLSSKHYPKNAPEPSQKSHKPPPVKFDIWGVQIALPIVTASQAQPLQIVWHRRGDDVPLYVTYDASRQAFLFVGSSSYLPINIEPTPSYEPSPDEIAPIPRKDENLDGTPAPASDLPKPPPYSWTQTEDMVTVAIPLPSDTPTSHIKVAFSPRTLTVLVEGAPAAPSADVPVVVPRYTLKALWDEIRPGTSLWTFDRAAERAYGMLTLHLDKAHEGTRWPQVFAAAGQGGPDGEEEVPETLDPSELYAIREALEKYTAALRDGSDPSGLGLGKGVPSLGQGERDDDVDLSVGKSTCVTWVGVGGAHPAWLGKDGHGDDAPLQLLSTPFPGSMGVHKPSLVAKNGLDGVVYTLQPGSNLEDPPKWEHTATYSALAFVLASKRDTRFVHHITSKAVFAFESGTQDLGGNVYIYRGVSAKENWAKQTVLKVGGGTAGALLGVGLMKVQGKVVVLCLCEGELIVLHDVL
ncbi:hypothetical protein FKP32DRAFT_1597420 [Trametes sanguinea]|nr:hypothetical protein FKP32DRAFT_1597420 [Trametes sanguinea]